LIYLCACPYFLGLHRLRTTWISRGCCTLAARRWRV
jgi:hypothetical protein